MHTSPLARAKRARNTLPISQTYRAVRVNEAYYLRSVKGSKAVNGKAWCTAYTSESRTQEMRRNVSSDCGVWTTGSDGEVARAAKGLLPLSAALFSLGVQLL